MALTFERARANGASASERKFMGSLVSAGGIARAARRLRFHGEPRLASPRLGARSLARSPANYTEPLVFV